MPTRARAEAKPPADPEPEQADAPEAVAIQAGGALEVAAVKRAWPAIQAAFKKLRPSRSHLFDASEVEVSGDSLVVEFPKDQRFALELASDAETMQLLRRSIASVLGVTPPVEFRLGRSGSSTPAAKPKAHAAPAPAAQSPAPTQASQPDAAAAAAASAGDPADIERMLIDELGAAVVSEIPHEDNE